MELITLKTFDNPIDAHLLKTKLESEGVPVYIFDENINTLNPLYNIATGGIKLKISEADIDIAIQVIQDAENARYLDEHEEAIRCPVCGSDDLYNNFRSMKGTKGFLSAIVSFLLMIFPIYVKVVYKCKNCEHEFRPDKKQS
jgi:DNA-directed RNA polymerase subunit RPC12/RpoP